MLKKAGIVVAAAAAGLLAVSPLAFAGEFKGESEHHKHHHHGGGHEGEHEEHGHGEEEGEEGAACHQKNSAKDESDGPKGKLVNISDIAVQVPIQACNNSVIEGVLGILAKDQSNDDSHGGTD